MNKSKLYTNLEKSISKSRLETYSTNNDKLDTIANYILNAKISQNFYFLLQNIEVSLRNAIYTSFKKHYPNNNFFYTNEINPRQRYRARQEKHSRECWKMICGVKYKLRHKTNITDDDLISTFNFGFWTELLISNDNKYTTMWRKIFNDVFPYYTMEHSVDTDKIKVANTINDLRVFRNRLFHYEPILNEDLNKKHNDILDVLGWLNEDMKQINILFDDFESIQDTKIIKNNLLELLKAK
jgi:hypothetical protein